MPRWPPIAPLALERRIELDGWTTLVLKRARCGARSGVAPRVAICSIDCRVMFEAHFQSFEDRGERGASAPRVAALRAELKRRGLDGFIVPRADRYQNEYVPPCAERLAWLTGFTGSAGARDRACRPRRHFRRRPLSGAGRARKSMRRSSPSSIWSNIRRRPGSKRICRPAPSSAIRRGCIRSTAPSGSPRPARRRGASLVAVDDNPIDAGWTDRPPPPLGAVVLHDLRYAGEDAAGEARARPRRHAESSRADALVVSDPHAVSWLFNIRGSDVPHTPVALAFAIVPKEGRPALYVDGRKLGNDVRAPARGASPRSRADDDFERDLVALGKAQRAVRLDPAVCPEAIARLIADNGGKVLRGSDPIAPMKAVKNACRDRRRARGAAARRRGRDALSRLVRPRSAARTA